MSTSVHDKSVQDFFKDRSDEDLQEEYQELYGCVELAECFSARDVVLLELAEAELQRRGYEIVVEKNVSFEKSDEEDMD